MSDPGSILHQAPGTAREQDFHLGAVILAAGSSSRMGQPKLLLPWGESSVLGHLLGLWKQLGAEQIGVVHAGKDRRLLEELDRLGYPAADRIANLDPERGMFSSIQCAAGWAGWNGNLSHWAVVLGDQPHLGIDVLRPLLDFATAHPQNICQPGRAGRPRHPVILPRPAFTALRISTVANLKQFLQEKGYQVALCEIADPGLDLDMDDPADYEKARKLFRAHSQK